MRCPRAVLAAVAAGLVLAGCQSDPEPRIADPTTESTSTPTEPTTPPTSESPTVDPATETAEEFIRRFHRTSTEMQNSGSTDDYAELADNCVSCDRLIEQVSDLYDSGGRAEIGPVEITNIREVAVVGRIRIFRYTITSSAGRLVDARGELTEQFPGGASDYEMNLRKSAPGWVVTELTQL